MNEPYVCAICGLATRDINEEFNIGFDDDGKNSFDLYLCVLKCLECSTLNLFLKYAFIEYPFKEKTYFGYKLDRIYPNIGKYYPVSDMPREIRKDFIEASLIEKNSPRGASALLRLALHKLCIQFGAKGKFLNDDIAFLIKRYGLSQSIQKMLDIIRVNGSLAVHPGLIDDDTAKENLPIMFNFLNQLVDQLIVQPKIIDKYYNKLPEDKRKAIEKRESKNEL